MVLMMEPQTNKQKKIQPPVEVGGPVPVIEVEDPGER